MGVFDHIFEQSNQLGASDYTWVDADTIRDKDDKRYRLESVDAPEIAKVDPATGLPYKGGTAGAAIATNQLINLANTKGFDVVVKTGRFDPNGREIIRLQDKRGRDFATELLKSGALKTNKYSTNRDALAAEIGELFREREGYEDNDWDKARNVIDQAISDESFEELSFKTQAVNETQPGYSPQFRNYDRDLNNKAVNPLSESLDLGFTGVQEGMWGLLNLIGESTGWDALSDIGDAGVYRARAKIADKPELKLSAVKRVKNPETGEEELDWDINSWGEAFEFLANNAAVSLPYMAVTVGGALAAPVTGGLSLLAPVSVYTGQTWNEMEGDKNAGIAIAAGVTQAALDRLGLKGLVGGSILNKTTRDTAVRAIMDRDGVSREVALNILGTQTRKEIAALAGDAAQVAGQQLKARNVLRGFAGAAGKGLLSEASTEAAQELTAYIAATQGSDKVFNAAELQERLINASIAGGTLGSAFAVPGTAYDIGAWADVAVRQADAEAKRLSRAGQFAKEEVDKHGRVQTIQELNEENEIKAEARSQNIKHWQDRVKEYKARDKGTAWDQTKEIFGLAPALWRGATRFIFNDELQNKSRAARVLADMFGANLQRTYSGSNFENRKHHLLSQYKNMVADPADYAKAAGLKTQSDKVLQDAIQSLKDEVLDAETNNRNVNWDNVPQEHRTWLSQYYSEILRLGDKLHADQLKHNPNLGYIKNYLFHYKAFDKVAIEKDKNKFIQALVDHKNYNRRDAEILVNEIINSNTINGEEDFHIGHGRQVPGAHRARTLNLADDPNFNDFMDNNPFNNISSAAKSAARFIAYQEFIGDDNKKVNELMQQMIEDGVPEAEVNQVASRLQDYLDAESGNYKRIKSDTFNKIQKNLMFWTTLAGLPLATISSFVELALTTRALTNDQIFTTIKNAAKEGAKGMFNALNRFDSKAQRQINKNERQAQLKDLGYFNWDVGAAHTTGVTETNARDRERLDKYFKLIGLQQWTDYTRAVRGAIADDYVLGKLKLISTQRSQGTRYTNEVQEAEEHLRNLGINVDDMIQLYDIRGPLTPEQEKVFNDNMREAQFNFINEAVALPQSANRPLIYQNPHLALFTQFQGFIATFTANHIPKMWSELVSRGTPAMKYNAFAVMTSMIALGFASQYLKDLIKYFGPTPYLDSTEKFQRAIGASGLLGSGERVVNFFFPIYEQRSSSTIDWFFNTISGEAAALSNVTRAAEAGGHVLTGEYERGAYKGLKVTPFFGPLNEINRRIADAFFDNN